jgi:phage/plasmid-like protein (TIGR03299 family)
MAHEIMDSDNLFLVRQPAWHDIGTVLDDNPHSAEEALVAAKLDWEVKQKDVYVDGIAEPIAGYRANVRADINLPLGIVSSNYKVVQNKEAFSFLDALVGMEDINYETAGSLKNSKYVWALLSLAEKRKILGDEVTNYILAVTSHNGRQALKVCFTNVRVVCNNTLNLALSTAKKSWSTGHKGDITAKIEIAKRTLGLNVSYQAAFAAKASELSKESFSADRLLKIAEQLYPAVNEKRDTSEAMIALQKQRRENAIADLLTRFNADDLANHRNTKWAGLNALSDHIYHKTPVRKTAAYQEANMQEVITGVKLNKAYNLLLAA